MDNFRLMNGAIGMALKTINAECEDEELEKLMNLTFPDCLDFIKESAISDLPPVLLKIPVKYILMMALEIENSETEEEES